jgi:hypothetical protein
MGPSSLLTTHDQIRKEIYVKVLEFEQDSVRDHLVVIPLVIWALNVKTNGAY